MEEIKKSASDKKDAIVLPLILIVIIVTGIIGLTVLQKMSITNQKICKYLGGLWERKTSDPAHRCYTYQEFYR